MEKEICSCSHVINKKFWFYKLYPEKMSANWATEIQMNKSIKKNYFCPSDNGAEIIYT